MTRRVQAFFYLFAALLSVSFVFSHGTLVSYSFVGIGQDEITFILRIPQSEIRWVYSLPSDATKARERVERAFIVRLDRRDWTPERAQVFIDQKTSELVYEASAKAARRVFHVELISRLAEITDPTHTNLALIQYGDRVAQAVLMADKPRFALELWESKSILAQVHQFVVLGIEHIFTGYDHMLFLLALLIISTTLWNLVKIVSSFTVAHSVTLALATFGLVSLPTRFIESAIALSICYVAGENLVVKEVQKRWVVTFFFGLIHGFGFSNILRGMNLPREGLATALFSFNLGVEIGQVTLVALAFPLVMWMSSRETLRPRIVLVTSGVVGMFGTYWFVTRLFF